MKKKELEYEISSGNVFKDLELANPEERLAKAQLAGEINKIITEKQLNQSQAAKLLGTTQPKVSDLRNGRLKGFTMDRLFRFLNILGQYISINVSPRVNREKVTVTLPPRKMPLPRNKDDQSSTISISVHKRK